ncbi:MAG TPA: hypothetical protein DCK95_03925, partial [Anaerolineaceae bacterium]|nr:hypothetical protein [Anaerolineaceae bacterium]
PEILKPDVRFYIYHGYWIVIMRNGIYPEGIHRIGEYVDSGVRYNMLVYLSRVSSIEWWKQYAIYWWIEWNVL